MASHRTNTYQPSYLTAKRPFKRSAQLFVIEWFPVLVTLILTALVIGMALQLAY